jgi:phosphoribosylglycinamide formyltransferase-1
MTRKILVIRADELRHNALTSVIKKNGFIVCEIIQKKTTKNKSLKSNLMTLHFELRKQVENDFFYDMVNEVKSVKSRKTECHDINRSEVVTFAKDFDADLIITFGCSILKYPWLDMFNSKILGIHLGLSPYYRGSGTNFFPFVNNELGAVGYTLMKLNKGIDTGDIIHQSYATFRNGDDIHTTGFRLIRKMFDDILKISKLSDISSEFNFAIQQPNIRNFKLYRRQDFTEEALVQAQNNILNNSVENHINNVQLERSKFPLIREII